MITDGDIVPLREPCIQCSGLDGMVKRKGFNDVVTCIVCGTFGFNMPKTESGKKRQSCSTTHSGITPQTRIDVLRTAGFKCETCGIPASKSGGLQVGHIRSVKECLEAGMTDREINALSNLIAQCPECNLGLGKKSLDLSHETHDLHL